MSNVFEPYTPPPAPAEPAPEPKRKRGRPPRQVQAVAPGTPAPVPAPAAPKRKRGRPAKAPQSPAGAISASAGTQQRVSGNGVDGALEGLARQINQLPPERQKQVVHSLKQIFG